MADDEKPKPQLALQINTSDELSRGRFSNNLLVMHTSEEFILDWLLNSHSGTHLVQRIVVTPGHMKRVVAALQDNVAGYERQFGEIRRIEPKEPTVQ